MSDSQVHPDAARFLRHSVQADHQNASKRTLELHNRNCRPNAVAIALPEMSPRTLHHGLPRNHYENFSVLMAQAQRSSVAVARFKPVL